MNCPICGKDDLVFYEYGEQTYLIKPSGSFEKDDFYPDEGNSHWVKCKNCSACSDSLNGSSNYKLQIKVDWCNQTIQVEEF